MSTFCASWLNLELGSLVFHNTMSSRLLFSCFSGPHICADSSLQRLALRLSPKGHLFLAYALREWVFPVLNWFSGTWEIMLVVQVFFIGRNGKKNLTVMYVGRLITSIKNAVHTWISEVEISFYTAMGYVVLGTYFPVPLCWRYAIRGPDWH